ncbi:hypothetical protein LF1_15560 [Rubripirellula obstinata]|uniref:Uncharacterized protein n=1 Tax=Rubripirellula obstinata TaxID=406547 RepID=A0A5B1CFQ1_9BACT|nr:hypothetical protein LF1_15560 [Rubripirellula obstinata]
MPWRVSKLFNRVGIAPRVHAGRNARGETRGAMPMRLNKAMNFYWTKALHDVGWDPSKNTLWMQLTET